MPLSWSQNYSQGANILQQHRNELYSNLELIDKKKLNCSTHTPNFSSICSSYTSRKTSEFILQAQFGDIKVVADYLYDNYCSTVHGSNYVTNLSGVVASAQSGHNSSQYTTVYSDYCSTVQSTKYNTVNSTKYSTVQSTKNATVYSAVNMADCDGDYLFVDYLWNATQNSNKDSTYHSDKNTTVCNYI